MEYQISYLTGVKKLEPVKYWIRENRQKRWWRFDKVDYDFCTEFASLGGFETPDEIHVLARLSGFAFQPPT